MKASIYIKKHGESPDSLGVMLSEDTDTKLCRLRVISDDNKHITVIVDPRELVTAAQLILEVNEFNELSQ